MAKTIFKETFIILLTCISIGLIIAIIFYQYMPNNRVIPSKVSAYATPDNVKEEIKNADDKYDLTEQTQTYTITDADLTLYKKNQSYNPGKADPFAVYSEPVTPNTENGNSSNNNQNANTNKNTTDNYYTSAGVGSSTK